MLRLLPSLSRLKSASATGPEDRLDLLRSLFPLLREKGVVLIADEPANIPAFQTVFDETETGWIPILKKRGYLFRQRKP